MPLWHICILVWLGVSLFIHSLLFEHLYAQPNRTWVCDPCPVTLGVCDPQGQKIKKNKNDVFVF